MKEEEDSAVKSACAADQASLCDVTHLVTGIQTGTELCYEVQIIQFSQKAKFNFNLTQTRTTVMSVKSPKINKDI